MAKRMSDRGRRALGFVLFLLGALCLLLFVTSWRATERAQAVDSAGGTVEADFWVVSLRLSEGTALFVMVIAAGALGAFIHAATSYTKHAGENTLDESWWPWYLFRPVIGSALAVVLYTILRGGLLTTNADGSDINEYGIAAASALAGMFSKQAVEKLGQVFDTIFSKAPVPRPGDEETHDSETR